MSWPPNSTRPPHCEDVLETQPKFPQETKDTSQTPWYTAPNVHRLCPDQSHVRYMNEVWDCFRMGVVKADNVWCWILGKLTDSSIFRLDLPVYECQWSPASWAPFDIKCYLRLFHWRTRACLEDGCLSRCFTADCLMALPAGVSHMSSAGMSSHHFSGSVSRQPAGSHQFSSYERDRFPETAFPRQLSSTPSNWDGSVLEGVLNAGWKRMFSNDGCLTAAQKVGLTDRWQLQLKWECRMSVWFPALTVVVQQQIRSASYWTSHRWWVPDCV